MVFCCGYVKIKSHALITLSGPEYMMYSLNCTLGFWLGKGLSLIARPFPPPVFDQLQYAKTEGEGLGEGVTCMMSGRRENRHKGGGA